MLIDEDSNRVGDTVVVGLEIDVAASAELAKATRAMASPAIGVSDRRRVEPFRRIMIGRTLSRCYLMSNENFDSTRKSIDCPVATADYCCELRKIDADPPISEIRVCDPEAAASCAEWLHEGTLAVGESTPVCAASNRVSYQEWDPITAAWGPTTEARCEDGVDVEI